MKGFKREEKLICLQVDGKVLTEKTRNTRYRITGILEEERK